jgi:hypothetical protein
LAFDETLLIVCRFAFDLCVVSCELACASRRSFTLHPGLVRSGAASIFRWQLDVAGTVRSATR